MIRILETGDLHLGLKYQDTNKHPQGAELAERRFKALDDIVRKANEEICDFIVITGDLFDSRNMKRISKRAISRVAQSLMAFSGEAVLVLPGNHDFYSIEAEEENELWTFFRDECDGSNVVLLSKFEPYSFSVGEEKVVVYPAFCQCEVSEKNNLAWIRNAGMEDDGAYRIGVAHGAIKGKSIDNEGVYFVMTEKELTDIPMDIWLMGHTHVMFPGDLAEEYQKAGRIFNAGTHVQDSVKTKTEGYCVLLELKKTGKEPATVRAKRYRSGNVFFRRVSVQVLPEGREGIGTELRESLKKALVGLDRPNTSLELIISGIATEQEHAEKTELYNELREEFLEFPPPKDSSLSRLYTEDSVDRIYTPESFPSKVLKELLERPDELHLAAELMANLKGDRQ